MTEYIAESLQHLTQAAAGVYAPTKAEMRTWGLLIGFTKSVHEILQPRKDEEKTDKPVIVPVFRLAPPTAAAPATAANARTSTAERECPPPLTVDGQVYE